jgi:hypothetical protein
MKEIWMEKLVMLLDIYEEEVVGVHSVWEHITEKDEAWIISKKFWFIKWLVENDKIDLEKAKTLKSWHNAELFDFMEWFDGTMEVIDYHYFEDYEQLLMLLSISNSPIEDLVSYLR